MLPSYKSTETNNEVGAIWSSEDLIAPFTFPVYKDESEYDLEVKEVKNNIAIVFDKVSEKIRIKDSLEKFETELRNILTAAENLEKKKDGYINSENLDSLKSGLGIQFTFPEWESVYKLYINENAGESKINFNDFIEKIMNGIGDLNSKDIIDYDKDKILSKKISIKLLMTDFRMLSVRNRFMTERKF
ncbi:MAG: hypothetical protein IPP52_04710 [Ignavibacteria bacterium]|nr:hypothetical protein [Ignavibacteria bacterium]